MIRRNKEYIINLFFLGKIANMNHLVILPFMEDKSIDIK